VSRPDLFARLSPRVQKANQILLDGIQKIGDATIKNIVITMLAPLRDSESKWLLQDNPAAQNNAPVFCDRFAMRANYNLWWGGPAAGEKSHHCYPGGWLLHNATNFHSLQMLIQTARDLRGLHINTDAMFAGMLLHDCLKPQLLLWDNGELMADPEGSNHHVAALAEAYLQGAPPEVLIMLAGIHSGWWQNPEGVAKYLDQAAQLVDRPELARMKSTFPSLDFLPETWIMRQGEATWYTATKTAIQEVKSRLRELLGKLVPPEECRSAEWWILLHCDEIELLRNIAEGTFEETVRKVLLMTG
jgi:hypothetical protein